MTDAALDAWARDYGLALKSFLGGAGELVLHEAYELGRQAVNQGVGVIQIAAMHHEALAGILRDLSTPAEIAEATKSAALVEAEGLAVFEMAMRGYQEANGRLRALNAQLESRASELEAANKELDAFAYSVSHDLRAPLRAIDGFSSIVLTEFGPQLPAAAQRYLRLVCDKTQQMGRLINDLLDFSRLGRQPLQKRPVDLANLVREVWAGLHAERAGRQVAFTLGALPSCQADPSLLRQVIVNLLGNALKYSRQRESAVIEVGCRPAIDAAGGPVYFVKDNGVGFDMKYVDKLFGVFQRLHRAEDYEGTGVGLAIAQRILHRHGGRVWAEAQVNEGATFFFTLGGGAAPEHGSAEQKN